MISIYAPRVGSDPCMISREETLVLVDVMRKHGCKNIIFSSSATVYGDPAVIPITADCPKGRCTNPYGQTK